MVDDRWYEVVVAAAAQETDSAVGPLIESEDRTDVIGEVKLGQCGWNLQWALEPQVRRNQVEKLFQVVEANRA